MVHPAPRSPLSAPKRTKWTVNYWLAEINTVQETRGSLLCSNDVTRLHRTLDLIQIGNTNLAERWFGNWIPDKLAIATSSSFRQSSEKHVECIIPLFYQT